MSLKALVIEPPERSLPPGAAGALTDVGWEVTTAPDYRGGMAIARSQPIDSILMPAPSRPAGAAASDATDDDFTGLLRLIDAQHIAAVIIADASYPRCGDGAPFVDFVDPAVPLPELRGRFAMIERYHTHFRRMEQELRSMERLGKRLNQHFREVDQEMRLAARLQRDFLPQVRKPINGVQFATVFRPATWVSGDIYDVFRIDEEHTGFYVADAVGHGLAASLLTMFIKRAIVGKHVHGEGYTILTPAQTLTALNDALVEQALPNCQFVTACYGLLNHRTLKLAYARGGHPYPILITADGMVSDLKATGGLMGVFKGEEFPTFECQLRPGDKLILYSDGLELAFQDTDGKGLDTTAYHRAFEAVAGLPIEEMVRRIEAKLDEDPGSLNPRDDVTIVGLEVLRNPQPPSDNVA
ncbi:MAG: PP2C family protein-serine/threonine phosphatase [Planctomycetes bacterium]|nr:PP2C family protein-serine/threonine phosphatase [Planctomycetota bacterium]